MTLHRTLVTTGSIIKEAAKLVTMRLSNQSSKDVMFYNEILKVFQFNIPFYRNK